MQNKVAIVNIKQFYHYEEKLLILKRQQWLSILKNEEIATIINTIGAGVGADFNEKDSNYNKVIIMTDADTDDAIFKFFY